MSHRCFLDFIFQRRKETGSQELDFLEKVDEEFDKGVMNFPMFVLPYNTADSKKVVVEVNQYPL
jgi:hypothetical protein